MNTIYEQFVVDNLSHKLLRVVDQEDIDHIAMCLETIDEIVHGRQPEHTAGDFIQAILKKDFYTAFKQADSVNMVCMHIYASWAYNKMPA